MDHRGVDDLTEQVRENLRLDSEQSSSPRQVPNDESTSQKVSKINYDDGAVFEGQCLEDGRRIGISTGLDGTILKGTWFSDHFEGTHYEPDGMVFKGILRYGMKIRGKTIWPSGDTADGTYDEDNQLRKGVFCYEDGSKFEGEFVQGMPRFGTETDVDGTIRKGSWDEDGNVLEAEEIRPDGQRFKGTYLRNKKYEGVVHYVNGNVYTGTLDSSGMREEGVFQCRDGASFKGRFLMNQPSLGRWRVPHKTGWCDLKGSFTMRGRLEDGGEKITSSERFQGSFYDNWRMKQGTWRSKDGSVFVGEFDNDENFTKGKISYGSGGTYEGTFLAGTSTPLKGMRRFGNGAWFNGRFKDGQVAEGMYHYSNGTMYDGSFDHAQKWVDGEYHARDGVFRVTQGKQKRLKRDKSMGRLDYGTAARVRESTTLAANNAAWIQRYNNT